VAVSNAVGAGRFVYVAYSLELVKANQAAAFTTVLAATGVAVAGPVTAAAPQSATTTLPRRARTGLLNVSGAASGNVTPTPRTARTGTLTLTGVPMELQPRTGRTQTLTVTGAVSP
jgi:hypothetical protein